MSQKRNVEVFSAGCSVCEGTIDLVNRLACPSCAVSVLDMEDAAGATRAKDLGIRSVPAVVIDGVLADCCAGRGADEAALRAVSRELDLGGESTSPALPHPADAVLSLGASALLGA